MRTGLPELFVKVQFTQFWLQERSARAHFASIRSTKNNGGHISPLLLALNVLLSNPQCSSPVFCLLSSEVGNRLNAGFCLAALMRFMGDQPRLKNQDDSGYIYELLQVGGYFVNGFLWVIQSERIS